MDSTKTIGTLIRASLVQREDLILLIHILYMWIIVMFSGLTALVCPHMQLLGQLGYHQECPPTLTFFGLENVSKDVVPDVHNVFALGSQQIAHNV